MKGPQRCFRDGKGNSLPMVLVALAVGTLLVSPLLAHVSTGQKTTEEMERTLRAQYASDAGAEYAIWKLANDDGWRQGLTQGMPETLTVPDSVLVNGYEPVVQAVLVNVEGEGGGGGEPEYLQWVIWGNSETLTNPVLLSGSDHTINGSVHSNHTIKAVGANHTFNGRVEYVTSISVPASTSFNPGAPGNPIQVEVAGFPITWDIADFRPGGTFAETAAADGKYYQHGSWTLDESGDTIPEGLHYCTGDVSISVPGLAGNVTIVADGGKIEISGSSIEFAPYVAGLMAFSTKSTTLDAINISGAGNMGGTCFAPNGRIALPGAGLNVTGAFIADRVELNGSGATISLAAIELPQGGDGGGTGCEVYDIQSTAGETVTTVRVRRCESGLEILSWYVD